MNRQDALDVVHTVQQFGSEGSTVEAKAAHGGLPSRLYETPSAFANQPGGGVVVLGLDEEAGFLPVGVGHPQRRIAELGDMASRMVPPLRLKPVVVRVDQTALIVFEVPECDYRRKPCYYGPAGRNSGSYIRVGNSNRRMSDYEIFTYVSSRGQPTYDREPVLTATIDDLDRPRVAQYLQNVERSNSRLWRRLRLADTPFPERLRALDLAVRTNGDLHPTLASLLLFGVWPQKHLPSLIVTFVRYPGTEAGIAGPRGERFLDNRRFEGRLDEIVDDAVQHVVSNMRQGTLIEGVLHRTVLEYPQEAVREAIVNAVAHRDYGPMAQGTHVRIEMYPDRLLVVTPGGLHGPVNEHNLEEETSTRNEILVRLLEQIGLVENRGSGIPMMIAAMREAHLQPPQFRDRRTSFRVEFKNHTLLDPETVAWLNQFAGFPLGDDQRMALAYLRTNSRITNSDYRRLNNTSTVDGTRGLRELVDLALVEMHGTRRWAYYTLAERLERETPRQAAYVDVHLNARQERALRYLEQHGVITSALYCEEVAPEIGIRMARKDLKHLEQQGLVIRIGRTRGTHYVLPGSE